MTDVLIIFVDSLPCALLPPMPNLNTAPEKWSLIPGFGYSVNIHAEMFAGLLPDDVGYFGEWAYDPAHSPGWKWRGLLPLLDTVCRPYVLNRGLQYLLIQNYRPQRIMINIPLRYLDMFALTGDHILDDPAGYPHPSLFTEFPDLRVIPMPKLPKGERDRKLYVTGIAAIAESDSLLLPLPDLDGFGHSYGITGEPYREHLARLDTWIPDLTTDFLTRHPQGHVFVVSDHGMVNVEHAIRLDVEREFGRATRQTYAYFSDANLLRVWAFDESLRPRLRTYLDTITGCRLVTPEERAEYGLTSPAFGDLIYVLEEGYAFEPSTFARHKPVGMHGYHPLAPGQQAVALHYGSPWCGAPPHRMRDLYEMLRAALRGTW